MRMNIMKERDMQAYGVRPVPYAFHIHLELGSGGYCLDDAEKEILKEYGKMQEQISRDFIVPGDITLHALHYAINRAFGWQNSHLHSFRPYGEDYRRMVEGGMLVEWGRLAGLYFRFPTGDFQDLYWDDDYGADVSIKTWLRRKYTGPYYYGGTGEYYYKNQEEVQRLFTSCPTLEVHKPFHVWWEESRKLTEENGGKEVEAGHIERTASIRDITVDELERSITFDGAFDGLIERLPLYDILLMPDAVQDFEAWRLGNEKIIEAIGKQERCLAPATLPILKELLYEYDSGDGWQVRITAVKEYQFKEDYGLSGYPAVPLEKHRPVCIQADALPVCDDVGGLSGYCSMLEAIHGSDPEEKESYKDWARSMGWTGRLPKPENIL